MPPRATTDALLRLRQADEQEAMRALQRARDGADRARALRDQAVAGEAAIAARIDNAGAAAAHTAGQLGRRDVFRQQLRAQLDAARQRVQITARALRDASTALEQAQKRVEQALRAREAAETQRQAEDKQESRKRDRREQAAVDDRWRPKTPKR